MGGDKEAAQVLGDLCQVLNGFLSADLPAQLSNGKFSGSRLFEKFRVQAFQPDIFHDGAGDADSIERLDAGGTVGQDADGAGGCDGGDRGVALPQPVGLQETSPVGGEQASLLSEAAGRFVGL